MTSPDPITARFAEAVGVLTNPPQTARSHHGSYVPLDALLDHVRPVLAARGLAIVQRMTETGIQTQIIGTCGDTIDLGTLPMSFEGSSQQIGSAITYSRRYAIAAALGVFGDTDDDGNANQPAKPKRNTQQRAGKISATQLKRLQTQWSGIERNERLAAWHQIIGRPIETANDLTRDEATKILTEGGPKR